MFTIFKGKPKTFVSEEAYKNNLASQLKMSPQTVTQLREYGVTDNTELKLEYTFYTNSSEKSSLLAEALKKQNYSVEFGESVDDRNIQIITGWSVPILMTTEKALAWTEQMCRLGYEHDCDFDGWGTNPEQ